MITSVTFDDTIPYLVDRRSARFESADEWTITEEQPGRIRLQRVSLMAGSIDVVVQSMPYTLEFGPEPEPALAIGATMGLLSKAQRRGRP